MTIERDLKNSFLIFFPWLSGCTICRVWQYGEMVQKVLGMCELQVVKKSVIILLSQIEIMETQEI